MSLRTALKLDALVTGANGAAYLVAAGPLEDLLGLSPALLRGVGAFPARVLRRGLARRRPPSVSPPPRAARERALAA